MNLCFRYAKVALDPANPIVPATNPPTTSGGITKPVVVKTNADNSVPAVHATDAKTPQSKTSATLKLRLMTPCKDATVAAIKNPITGALL